MVVIGLQLLSLAMFVALWETFPPSVKTALRSNPPQAQNVSYDFITKLMDRTVNPCRYIYNYSCGKWDQVHSDIEDAYTLELHQYHDKMAEWLLAQPMPDQQKRVSGKVLAAYKLCHAIYTNHSDDTELAKQLFAGMGLVIHDEIAPNVDLLQLIVDLTLLHGIPTVINLQPKFDLRTRNSSRAKMVLSIHGRLTTPLRHWITVSAAPIGVESCVLLSVPTFLDSWSVHACGAS